MHVLWGAMEKLVAKGLTRAIGVSNFNTLLLADMLTYAKIPPAVNQICIYPCHAQQKHIDFIVDHGIVPVAYSPLGRIGSSFGPVTSVNLLDDPLIRHLAKKYNRTAGQVLLSWGLSRGYPVLAKASSLKHQKENFAVFEMERLT